MRKNILAANWKMNLSLAEAQNWLNRFDSVRSDIQDVQFRLYAPAVFQQELSKKQVISIGAQNVHPADSGAFTGECSIPQLKSVGTESVLIGHSERRQYFYESNAFLKQKVDACCQQDFPFIFCCGEELETRQAGEHLSFIAQQLKESILHIEAAKRSLLTIAYEPIWAIGTGQTANTTEINEVHAFIRGILKESFGLAGENTSILYGGSVNGSNARSIFSCPDVDGGLIGGASLNPDSFIELAHCFK